MSYSVFIEKSALKNLKKIEPVFRNSITEKIKKLQNNPRPKKLTGRDAWRVRSGDYRIIYEIDDKKSTVLIVIVGHRRDIYKK